MEIDKKIETEMGVVHFKGHLTEDELDYVVTIGLATLMIKSQIKAEYATKDSSIISEGSDTIQ